jgi:hypothetical protein
VQAGISRAPAVDRPDLAWYLARMLALHWAMNNRAADALALLSGHEDWVTAEGGPAVRLTYRLTRSSIFAFGDRLAEALEEGHLAIAAAHEAQDWPQALPAMSNVGVMHHWRGEYQAARAVLTQAREIRERLYGSSGSGIKIDIHLGAVLYECGEPAAAQALLEGAVAEMGRWPDNEYRRTECLLADNHLAQMFIALGRADDAARVLAHDASGVADRFYGRRLALRLRWQRLFGTADDTLLAELQALVVRVASPFNRALMELELARHQPASQALPGLQALLASPAMPHRPGLQLHAAALACQAAAQLGLAEQADALRATATDLLTRCGPYDMTEGEARRLCGACA